MRLILSLTFTVFHILTLYSQETIVVSGYVKDSVTKELLAHAIISVPGTGSATMTNEWGYYQLKIPANSTLLRATYIGYTPQENTISKNNAGLVCNFYLQPDTELGEIVVSDKRRMYSTGKAELGITRLEMKGVKDLPTFMGFTDVVKIVSQTPGVVAPEGKSEIMVRGGSNDQNLYLLDDVPLFYMNHLGGYYSVYNSDIIEQATLYKSGFPKKHGGRLSSVFQVRTIQPSNTSLKAILSVGFLQAAASLQAPIVKNKTSFFVSVRRSLLSHNSYLFDSYWYYDANFKLRHSIDDRRTINLTFF